VCVCGVPLCGCAYTLFQMVHLTSPYSMLFRNRRPHKQTNSKRLLSRALWWLYIYQVDPPQRALAFSSLLFL
jgi:hypothetical protein